MWFLNFIVKDLKLRYGVMVAPHPLKVKVRVQVSISLPDQNPLEGLDMLYFLQCLPIATSDTPNLRANALLGIDQINFSISCRGGQTILVFLADFSPILDFVLFLPASVS